MFYSHSLISRKGPLGTIWIAAYFCKKLKKEQIAKTNIASSVDEIIPDSRISYRMLSQLLVGIVRIFSMKVDYLYQECNETLLRISRTFVSSPRYPSERTACAPHYKETTRKPVHGSRVSVHVDNEAKKAPQVSSPEKAMFAPYRNVSITIPETFELDAFDLGIEDQGDHLDAGNQQLTLEGEDVCDSGYASNTPYLGRTSDLFFDVACFTPAGDVVSHEILDVNLENNEFSLTSTGWPEREGLSCDLAPEGNRALSRARKSLDMDVQMRDTDESLDYADPMEVQHSEQAYVEAISGTSQEKPRTPERKDSSAVQLAAGELQDHAGVMDDLQNEQKDTEAESATTQINGEEKPRTPDRTQDEMQHHDVVVEFQQSDHPTTEAIPKDGQEKPNTPDRTQDISNGQLVPASLMFTVSTPAEKERRRFSRKQRFSKKRKCLFDEDIVLSNKELRQMIRDATNLVLKRRKVPHTCLDLWKSDKFYNIKKALTEPLIPHNVLEIKDLRPRTALDTATNMEPLHPEQFGELKVPMELADLDIGVQEAPADVIASGDPLESHNSSKASVNRESRFIAQETQDLELNLEDQELSSLEEGTHPQDGLSSRTRSVGQFFCKCLMIQKERGLVTELSLTKILEGRKKRPCAMLFYETLVLKTRSLIDVMQAAPYADISIMATPCLTESCGVDS